MTVAMGAPDLAAEDSVGTSEESPAERVRTAAVGLWLFIISEACLFSAFIAARYVLEGLRKPDELDQPLGLAVTTILLASSFTAYLAEAYSKRSETRRSQIFIWATVLLGALFLTGVALELTGAGEHFPTSTRYGTAYFSLISLHAFHVITGMGALIVSWNLVRLDKLSELGSWRVEAAVKYWHFVDLAWVVIFPTLYLVS